MRIAFHNKKTHEFEGYLSKNMVFTRSAGDALEVDGDRAKDLIKGFCRAIFINYISVPECCHGNKGDMSFKENGLWVDNLICRDCGARWFRGEYYKEVAMNRDDEKLCERCYKRKATTTSDIGDEELCESCYLDNQECEDDYDTF